MAEETRHGGQPGRRIVALRWWFVMLVISLTLAACGGPRGELAPLPTLASLARVTSTPTLPAGAGERDTAPPSARAREGAGLPHGDVAPRGMATATATPAAPGALPTTSPSAPTVTPDPYAGLGIEDLAARDYGGGLLRIEERLERNDAFARYLFRYPSDGLELYGFMDVPHEGDRFPVALVLHGYLEPDVYELEPYTARYADALARAGYMVFHPNFRNYPPSDEGENPFRIGYAIDVLNLIAIIHEQSQDPTGPLRRADAANIHLMGHSMGGGVALRVAVVWPEAIQAVALYGAMSGDEALNYARIRAWSGGRAWRFEEQAPPLALRAISPVEHLDRLLAPVSLHHGAADTVVPPAWSDGLCALLQSRHHPVECFTYEGQPHTFYGAADDLFQQRLVDFFRSH